MKILSEQKSTALAEKNGWSLEFADGFLKGENSRKFGVKPSAYDMVGRDDCCLGFRAGYFARRSAATMRVEIPAAPEWTLEDVALGTLGASASATTFKPDFVY